MRNTTTGIALGATVLVHAGIAWWLLGLRDTVQPRASRALEVIWIERPASAPSQTTNRVPASPPPAVPPARTRPPPDALQTVDVAPATDEAEAEARLPTAHDLLEQAGQWAREQTPAADFSHDPLRRRARTSQDGRFAMRDPVTAQDVVRGIGQLLGGPGYTEDPCPQIRRNIANAGNGSDAALAAEEVRRLQRFCL